NDDERSDKRSANERMATPRRADRVPNLKRKNNLENTNRKHTSPRRSHPLLKMRHLFLQPPFASTVMKTIIRATVKRRVEANVSCFLTILLNPTCLIHRRDLQNPLARNDDACVQTVPVRMSQVNPPLLLMTRKLKTRTTIAIRLLLDSRTNER